MNDDKRSALLLELSRLIVGVERGYPDDIVMDAEAMCLSASIIAVTTDPDARRNYAEAAGRAIAEAVEDAINGKKRFTSTKPANIN